MNTRSISGAARVICEAEGKPNAVPATIAVALDATGWLNTEEVQAELVRLRLLQNAQPAELSEAQLEALIDAGNEALNDYYHERACSCSDWPQSCSSSAWNFAGAWDTDAFAIGMASVIGAWESMRAPAEVDEIARLRDRVAELEAELRTVVAARDAQIVAWLGKKAREYGSSNREARDKAEAVGRMADKLRRGAVRPLEDQYVSPLHQNHKLGHDLELPEVPHV
ncbi:hypothetical protein [Streptomyces virginiae]|uniref:hypothetical protein n=1 Tax=Streptomyces virginiae TaxID=1961 RepID=UPI0036AB7DCA